MLVFGWNFDGEKFVYCNEEDSVLRGKIDGLI